MLRSASAALLLRRAPARALSTAQTLPKLPYAYDALAPVLSAELMELHHSKHHAAYVTNLNAALLKNAAAEAAGDVATMVALQPAIRFNGGGHINHSIFWTNLAPAGKGGGGQPSGALADAIKTRWGSFDDFKKDFSAKAVGVQGSGWAWLAYDPAVKGLTVVTCANQDPCSATGNIPIWGVDVWEHAYYLNYKNVRANYLDNIWQIANWQNAAERFAAAKGGK